MAFIIDGSTGIATVDGSVSAPSQRGQDSNSGISYGADSIKFSTNGVERLAISNSGISGDGSGLTGIGGGITDIDYYRLTSNFQGNSYHIQNNWARTNSQMEGKKGTGISESSGLFSFPSTGYYYVEFNLTGYRGAGSTVYNITQYIRTTNSGNTSSGTVYNLSNNTSMYSESGNSHHTQSARLIVKCSNVSNEKVFFGVQAEQYIYIQGSSSANFTYVLFIKLADL